MRTLILLSALCGACVNQATLPWQITQTEDSRTVTGCEFLGLVHGRPPAVSGLEPGDAVGAHNDAMNEAAALGATHLVWRTVNAGTAQGSAFRCH